MLKKILAVITILIIATTILIGGYFLVIKTAELITGSLPTPSDTTTPTTAKLTELSDNLVFDYWAYTSQISTSTPATTSYYYLTPTGEIFKATADQDEPVASQPIQDLQSITPSKDGSLVLVTFGNKIAPQFSILNIKDRSWQPLPTSVRTADFSPDRTQLAILTATNGKNDLVIQDLMLQPKAKKLGSKKILYLYQKGLTLKWLNQETILLIEKPSQLSPSSIWQVDIKTASIKPLISDKGDLSVEWSKNGTVGVQYALNQNQQPIISVIDSAGTELNSLDLLTSPDKCLVDFSEVFCSAPNTLTSQTIPGLLDMYLKKGFYSDDTLHHYNRSASGEYTLKAFIEFETPTDATHLIRENTGLVFVNRLDQKLYRLDLK